MTPRKGSADTNNTGRRSGSRPKLYSTALELYYVSTHQGVANMLRLERLVVVYIEDCRLEEEVEGWRLAGGGGSSLKFSFSR